MEKIYDLIILGGGTAGLSAGLYAGRARLDTVIMEKGEVGGQAATTSEIVNYPGIENISGPKLSENMKVQAEKFGVQLIRSEVTGVDFSQQVKKVITTAGEYKSRAVIIATGARSRKLGFPGESEFTGRGIAYCATCDGEFFTGLEVFVIGAGYAAAEEGMYLTRFAKKVTIVAREPEFTCAKSIAERVFENEKIEVKFNTEILEATGEGMINYAQFRNNDTGKIWEHRAGEAGNFGIFVFIGYEPITDIFKGHIKMDKSGYIPTDENMKTDISGVYAVGDLRPKFLRQIVTAVSDGAIAATDAEKYITEQKRAQGIKDFPIKKVSEAEKSTEDKKDPSETFKGKSSLLDDGMREQLRDVFEKMKDEITLVTVVDKANKNSVELKEFLEDIEDLGGKIDLKVYMKGENPDVEKEINADKFPVVSFLDKDGKYRGIKFHGVPGGHELNSFILAIYNLSGPGQEMTDEILGKINEINKKVNVKVIVSLSCHYCPDVVVAAQQIAIKNENIEAEMVNIMDFPQVKEKYNIMSVPAILINDEEIHFGAKDINEIIDLIK